MRVPDLIEPVVGWRCWRIVDATDGFALLSVARETRWEPGRPIEAACETFGHPEPDPSCRCGIHAAAAPEVALDYLPPHARAHVTVRTPAVVNYDRVIAVGRAALWGTVVECAWGWRGQLAYPVELWIPSRLQHLRRLGTRPDGYDSTRIATELETRYRVPVAVTSSFAPDALAAAAGFQS